MVRAQMGEAHAVPLNKKQQYTLMPWAKHVYDDIDLKKKNYSTGHK